MADPTPATKHGACVRAKLGRDRRTFTGRLPLVVIAWLLCVGTPWVDAQPGSRVILIAAFDGVSGGVTVPAGWHKLFDVEDTTTKQVSCAAVWRDDDGSVGPLNIQTANNVVSSKAFAMRVTGFNPASPPEAATTVNGITTKPQPPRLRASWGTDDNLWLVAICTSRPDLDVGARASRVAEEAPAAATNTRADATITATIAVRGIAGQAPRWTATNLK